MPRAVISLSRVIEVVSDPGDAGARDTDQERQVWRSDRGDRHDPARLAHAEQSDLGAVDIASRLRGTRTPQRRRRQGPRTMPCSSRRVEPPTPRLSYPSTAMPCRIRKRANGRTLSRFAGPEKCTRMIAGCFAPETGLNNVPAKLSVAVREADVFPLARCRRGARFAAARPRAATSATRLAPVPSR